METQFSRFNKYYRLRFVLVNTNKINTVGGNFRPNAIFILFEIAISNLRLIEHVNDVFKIIF